MTEKKPTENKVVVESYAVELTHCTDTGVVMTERWRNSRGDYHRLNGPAFVQRDPDTGVATEEYWFKEGVHHRIDGPAVILRRVSGRIYEAKWYQNGTKIAPPPRSLIATRASSRPKLTPSKDGGK